MLAPAEPRRGPGRPPKASQPKLTFLSDLLARLEYQLEATTKITFPSTRYRADPVAFAREILGIEPWDRQREILEAIRDHMRVAISSGNKLGKSTTAVIAALWFYCSYPEARVVLSATTAQQVDSVLWRELSRLRQGSGRCIDCKYDLNKLVESGLSQLEAETRIPRPCPHSAVIDGHLGAVARSGLRSADHRHIMGIVVRSAESVSGISGPNQLWIIDEASGVADDFFDALEGNLAGGAREVKISNPTRTVGRFYDAFHSKREFHHCIQVSTEETPNAKAGHVVIPGLATREWIDAKRLEWGEESALFKIRVKGQFPVNEDGKIFSIARITHAETRWASTVAEGRLYIGLDPAGPTGTGDESVFCLRRGNKVIEFHAHRGLNDDGHLVNLLGLIETQRVVRREPVPVVVIDREGSVGSGLYGRLRQYREANPRSFELVAMRASDRAIRNPEIYDRIRDELAANLESAFRDGLAIPEDAKLTGELHVFEWRQAINGRYKLEPPKEDVRKILGRSPDRFDALCLACWVPTNFKEGVESQGQALQRQVAMEAAVDPYNSPTYGGHDAYRGGYYRRGR